MNISLSSPLTIGALLLLLALPIVRGMVSVVAMKCLMAAYPPDDLKRAELEGEFASIPLDDKSTFVGSLILHVASERWRFILRRHPWKIAMSGFLVGGIGATAAFYMSIAAPMSQLLSDLLQLAVFAPVLLLAAKALDAQSWTRSSRNAARIMHLYAIGGGIVFAATAIAAIVSGQLIFAVAMAVSMFGPLVGTLWIDARQRKNWWTDERIQADRAVVT